MDAPTTMGTRTSFAAIVENEGSFRAWYDDALPRVYRYLLARCGDELLAEELTQQTFVDGVRRRDRFDGRSDVVTWLCAIGRNKLVDHYRRAARNERRMNRLIAQQRVASDGPLRAIETREAVLTALDQLSGDQRLALIFRHLDGLSVREVAAIIGRSEKATESLLTRARETFRRAYGDQTDA